jgi:hypothetical protein
MAENADAEPWECLVFLFIQRCLPITGLSFSSRKRCVIHQQEAASIAAESALNIITEKKHHHRDSMTPIIITHQRHIHITAPKMQGKKENL